MSEIFGGNEAWDLVARSVCKGDEFDGPNHSDCYGRAQLLLTALEGIVRQQQQEAEKKASCPDCAYVGYHCGDCGCCVIPPTTTDREAGG